VALNFPAIRRWTDFDYASKVISWLMSPILPGFVQWWSLNRSIQVRLDFALVC
jgi:hypothetical protein